MIERTPARDIDAERLRAWGTLARAYQAVVPNVVAEIEADDGIDSGVFSVLSYLELAHPPGRMRFAELRSRMRVRYSQPGLTRMLQRMESDELIERRPDTTDGRGTLLVITRRGRARYNKATTVYRVALGDHFARHMSSEDARTITEVLGRFLESAGHDDEVALPT